MPEIKIEKLALRETAKVFGGDDTKGGSAGGTSGVPTDDTCACSCSCGLDTGQGGW